MAGDISRSLNPEVVGYFVREGAKVVGYFVREGAKVVGCFVIAGCVLVWYML